MMADVLILGGGAAGCVLAARLSEDPARRVVLVEAGPDYGAYTDGRWPAALLDARADGARAALGGGPAESHDWGFPGVSASRARVIGGCSSHNGCEVLLGAPADYDRWAALTGDPAWSSAGFASFLARAAAALRVRPSVRAELSPIRALLLDAADEVGLPFLPDLNAPTAAVGAGLIPVNAAGWLRWGAAFAYLDPARDRPNLTILAEALVDRVVVEDGRAVGAVVRRAGREETVGAGLVVLAAGAYGSPAILQRSGVGEPTLLRSLGIPVIAESPAVGAGLLDHPYVLLSWSASDEPAAPADAPLALSELKWASSRCAPGAWDVTVGAWSGAVFDQRAHATGGAVAGLAPSVMGSLSRGHVAITSADPAVLPTLEHGFLSDPDGHDLGVLEEAVELCREVGATRAWRTWCGDEIAPGAARRGEALRAWLRDSAAGTYHPCGTLRMGGDGDPAAVVDPHGRVRGVDGLAVADASIFPSIPAANIHISVVAAAELLAERLG